MNDPKKPNLIAIAQENIDSLKAQGTVVKKMFDSASNETFALVQGFIRENEADKKRIISLEDENKTLKASLKAFGKPDKVPKAPKKDKA